MTRHRTGRDASATALKARRARLFAPFAALLLITGAAGLSGCSSNKHSEKRDPFAGKGSPIYPGKGPLPKGGGRYHVGKPYSIAGQRFVPRENPNYDEVGIASWYGPKFHRRMTSNGEWFDMEDLTAAHTTMPLPSYAKVTNMETGRSLVVRVNDRGPFVNNRVIDLSKRSAEILEVKKKGTGKVRVQYIGPAPLNDNGRHLMAMNEELRRGTPMQYMIASAAQRSGVGAPPQIMTAQASSPRRPAAAQSVPVQTASMTTSGSASGSMGRGSGYYVQAAALSSPDNANRARNQLAALGPIEIAPLDTGTRRLFRVRVGPIEDPHSADSTLQGVIAAGYPDARIVPASY